MKKILAQEMRNLQNAPYVSKKTLQDFNNRINKNMRYVKSQNAKDHFCSFFLPVHVHTRSIYLVHHKKAEDWIPPGGHIELGERPIDTVIRELKEELQYVSSKKDISLFNLTVKDVTSPKTTCIIHYDLWYLVKTQKVNFTYLKKEFYSAGWFSIRDGIKRIRTDIYRETVNKLAELI